MTNRGDIKSYFRQAFKILARDGLGLAWVRLPFDAETKISDLKAWNLKPTGVVHEVGQKDAVETQLLGASGVLYEDKKTLLLLIPQVDVDSIIAYEYERRHRPYVQQDAWIFQQRHPVLSSRFELQLPKAWEFTHRILQHPDSPPREVGNNRWMWQLSNLAPIPDEEGMPPLANVSAQLLLSYFPSSDPDRRRGETMRSWDDVAAWMGRLMDPRLTASPPMVEWAQKLGSTRALAEFVQKDIRYVAIEIGIGGYQPHPAEATFRNRYGDCKDKVTLLRSLSKALNREVYPVLIHTARHNVDPAYPSPLYFNHVIAAIPLDDDQPVTPAVLENPELGRLLLFDPTDTRTPFGQIRSALQGHTAVLLRSDRGHLIETPVTPPTYNRILRTGNFQLAASGALSGEVAELYWGESAALEADWLKGQTHEQWIRASERALARRLPGAFVKNFSLGTQETANHVRETYVVEVANFAQRAGELVLFRPALLQTQLPRISRLDTRNHPYHFTRLHSSGALFTFALPAGCAPVDLPAKQEIDRPYIRFRQEVRVEAGKVVLSSLYEIKSLVVPAEEFEELRRFFQEVDRISSPVVVLACPPQPGS